MPPKPGDCRHDMDLEETFDGIDWYCDMCGKIVKFELLTDDDGFVYREDSPKEL